MIKIIRKEIHRAKISSRAALKSPVNMKYKNFHIIDILGHFG